MAASAGLLIHSIRDVTIVNFSDTTILDTLQVEEIGEQLYALVDQKACKRLVLDFSNVKLLSSSAIGVLITLRKKLDQIKGQVVLCSLRKDLSKVFKITRLDKMFTFCDNEEQALAVFGVSTTG